MAGNLIQRRNFLKTAGQILLAIPALAAINSLASAELLAQPPAKAQT